MNLCYAPTKSKLQHPPTPGKRWAFELLKIRSFKFPPPQAKVVFKCPTLLSGFCLSNAPPKEHSPSLVPVVCSKPVVYIRGTQRHQFKMESYFIFKYYNILYYMRGAYYLLKGWLSLSSKTSVDVNIVSVPPADTSSSLSLK